MISQSLLRFMSIESVMPSNHFIVSYPLSYYFQSFPASGSFPVSQLFTSGGPSIGVSDSASVLPINIQGWFPLMLTCLISWQSKGLSRVFSSTRVQKHKFFSAQPSYWSNIHIHSFDYIDICWQSNVLLFNMLSSFVIAFLSRSSFKDNHCPQWFWSPRK